MANYYELDLVRYIEEAKEAVANAFAVIQDMYRDLPEGYDPDEVFKELAVLEESLEVAERHIILPEWLQKAADAQDEMLYDLECKADAISY